MENWPPVRMEDWPPEEWKKKAKTANADAAGGAINGLPETTYYKSSYFWQLFSAGDRSGIESLFRISLLADFRADFLSPGNFPSEIETQDYDSAFAGSVGIMRKAETSSYEDISFGDIEALRNVIL